VLTTRTIILVAAMVGVVTLVALAVLVALPAHLPDDPVGATGRASDGARDRRGRGRTGTITLAARRQVHQERVAVATEADAAERRTTELYAKSVEQRGSEKSAVRLGGLYALERLAQTSPGQRQTVVNVICAYLRMPYQPPIESLEPATDLAQGEAKKYRGTSPGVSE
jgi:hypothetical protein